MPKLIPIEDRFFSKLRKLDNGCWQWLGQITPKGYGRFSAYGKSVSAYKFAYEHFVRPVPPGLSLDHNCHTSDPTCCGGVTCLHRRCVRPDHLVPMTLGENVSLAYPARKTHCAQGHEFTEANTRTRFENGYPKRTCRTCSYVRKNESRSKGRAEARALRLPKPKPTHCRYGHPYAGENLYVVPSTGVWQCRTCGRASEARRKARRAAAKTPVEGNALAA